MTTPAPRTSAQAAWYPDPSDPGLLRYWDGRGWTGYTLPKPAGWGHGSAGMTLPWWQSWWVVIPGLLICLPFGLVGLWKRPGLATWSRVVVTLATVALLGGVILTDDSSTTPEEDASKPAASPAAPTPKAAPDEAVPSRSVVPKLTGLTRRQAEKRVAAGGLAVRKLRYVPSAQPRGTVLRQSKRVGASVLAGSALVLTVAAPYPRVPTVVGRSQSVAVSRLRDAGFKVKVSTESRTSGKDGVILRQTPAGSNLAKPRSLITVVVSSVVKPVAPPPPPPAQNCASGYSPCLPPAYDYDCAGGSGDGPGYADGPIYVTGSDPYGLDRDGDGVACES